MVGRILKTAALGLFIFTLACCTLLAQSGPAIGHTSHSGIVTASHQPPAGLVSIFSNLGPTATDNYNDTTGYYVLGPSNTLALSEQWIALPFTPKKSSHVEEVEAAVQLEDATTTNQFLLGLYSDNAGAVGTLLAQDTVKNAPAFGTCCTLVTARFKAPGISVTAGTQYWIVASSDDVNAPNFTGVWAASNNANIGGDVAMGGWFTFSANWPAGAALGTVP
jgi:hypothetical protein